VRVRRAAAQNASLRNGVCETGSGSLLREGNLTPFQSRLEPATLMKVMKLCGRIQKLLRDG